MSNDNRVIAKYASLFTEFRTELDCFADSFGKLAASECALSDDKNYVPALRLPQCIDLDKIIRLAAEKLGRKVITHAAQSLAPAGSRRLKINVDEFSSYWRACPHQFDPVVLWNALRSRFGAASYIASTATQSNPIHVA